MKTVNILDIEDARTFTKAALKSAKVISFPKCLEVNDEVGKLIAFDPMEGFKVTTNIIANDKSYTDNGAKRTRQKYGELSEAYKSANHISSALGRRLTAESGVLSVMPDSEVVGAIGISSSTQLQDQKVVQPSSDHFLTGP